MPRRRATQHPPKSLAATIKEKWLTIVVHAAALIWLAYLGWRYFTDTLGVDSVKSLYTFTGRTAIVLLALSLAATPISFVFGFSKALSVRRPLGLYAFLYAVIHFSNFLILDYGLDLNLILHDTVLTKPYIVAGFLALLLLLPLAVTSTQGWQRRLRRNWTRLHRLVYLAAPLTALHFFWQAKVPDRFNPLLYATVLACLLAVRLPPVRLWLVRTRQRLTLNTRSSTHRPAPATIPREGSPAGEERA